MSDHDQGVDDMLVAFVVAVLIFALIVPIGKQEWSEFKPNLVAGFLALAGGVPIGLWLNRVAEKARRAREGEETNRRRQITLKGLLGEIGQHRKAYETILDHEGKEDVLIPLADCRMHFWHALAASGGLNLIDDVNLLNRLSATYYLTDVFNSWARTMREAYMMNTPIEYRQDLARRAWPHLLDAAKKASGNREEVVGLLRQALGVPGAADEPD